MADLPQPEGCQQRLNHDALADVIDRCRDEIVDRWMHRVEADLKPGLGVVQLRDAIPDYLRRLAAALRLGPASVRSLQDSGSAIWADVAREHALTRVRLGFDIDQLVHEFIVLRRVLSEVGREQGVLDVAQAARLADLVEAAVAIAVKTYVQARDYAGRQEEAKHIAFVTHELRNPLYAAKLAAARLRKATPESAGAALEVLERNLDRVGSLVDGVLQAERLEAGAIRPEALDVALGELLEPAIAAAKLAADAKGLTLRADYDPAPLLHVDPQLARSAVANVLDNAIKYTDAGEVRVAAEAADDHVTLHVRDSCEGLSEEELRTIFEPFVRGHSKKPGAGLGLAIARRALEAQGGAIGADSNEERGCHFWIALPRVAH